MTRNKIPFLLAALALILLFQGAMAVRAAEPPMPEVTISAQATCMKAENTTRIANLKTIRLVYRTALAEANQTYKAEKADKNPDARKHYLAARKAAQDVKKTSMATENARHRAAIASCKMGKTPEASAPEVAVRNFSFQPSSLTVSVGTSVTWKQVDSVPHQVESDTEAFKGPLMKAGETFTFTFDKPGSYPYHCTPHPSMKGTIIVK